MNPLLFLVNLLIYMIIPCVFAAILSFVFSTPYSMIVHSWLFILFYSVGTILTIIALAGSDLDDRIDLRIIKTF